MIIRPILTAFGATVAIFPSSGAAAHGPGDIVKPNFEQKIPDLPGKSLIAVEVEYPPGAASVPHAHAKSAFIYAYVVSGAIESKVNDGEVRVPRWRELVRTARRDPSRQPEREQNRPCKAPGSIHR